MTILDLASHSILYLVIASLTLYTIYGAVYRLYLSPLAQFPGPKLAALTLWYELYYDLILGGQYTFKLTKLHARYGPIIRISPWELHIHAPDFYDDIYASSASNKPRNKYSWFTRSFGMDNSMFATVSHDLHKTRRAALNPFFSKASVARLAPVVRERVDALLARFEQFRESGEVLNASHAFAAYTNDVVMEYAFARSDNRLEAPDFDPSYRAAAFFGSTAGNFMKHAPWLNALMQALPDSIARLLHPAMASFIRQKRNTRTQIEQIQSATSKEKYQDLDHPTIFHEILGSKIAPQEKSIERLSDEAQVLMMAGTLTTAWVLEVSTFHLLSQPSILRKLKNELNTALPADRDAAVPLHVLEQLPYLTAVIKETLRLTYGVAGRLARISPDEAIVFPEPSSEKSTKEHKTWIIPAGTPVGMSAALIHHDESIFPDSHAFDPSRWLDASGKLHTKLDRYLVSFTRGTRQCLGMNLSYAETYLCLVALWGRYGSEEVRMEGDVGVLRLFETRLVDVELFADSFLPLVKPGSEGIRLKVLK